MDDGRWVPPQAVRQSGLFTARQALDAGLTPGQLRVRRRRAWQHVAGDVHALAGRPVTAWDRARAAVLTWPDAVVCLRTAAILHGFPLEDDGSVHVAVTWPRAHRGALRVHELALGSADVAVRRGVPVTTASRTAIDCIGALGERESDAVLAWVVTRGTMTPRQLAEWLAAHPRARGNARRRAALRLLDARAASPAEALLHVLLRRAGIGGWFPNESLLRHVGVAAAADVYFPEARLVVEVDGARAHAGRFQSDRTRQNAIVNAGCRVLRFTWQDLTLRPAQVITAIRTALAVR